MVAEDTKEATCLFQRFSMALQKYFIVVVAKNYNNTSAHYYLIIFSGLNYCSFVHWRMNEFTEAFSRGNIQCGDIVQVRFTS